MKKILSLVLLVLVSLLAVGCKKVNEVPTINGAINTSVGYRQSFNPLNGISAYDKEDGDLTSKIVVTGEVNTDDPGEYNLVYSVTDSANQTTEAQRRVTVLPQSEVELASGWYNYKFASTETRHTLFAAAERWLLENAYAGIPLAEQAGVSLVSDRIQLIVDNYIPSFGWGVNYATITQDDAQVAAALGSGTSFDLLTSTPALAGQYTHRSWDQSEPVTLNPWTGESSVESDYQSYITGSFYTAVLNASHTNWEFANELASGDPIPSSPKNINGKIIAKTWDIPLKSDLRWSYNYETNTAGFPAGHDVLNAYDYIYSFRLALDNSWFRAFTGGSDFANLKIKGAAEYVNAVKTGATQQQLDALWADFGIKAVDSNTLRFQFLEDKSSFDIKYSIGWAPVHQNIYEADPDNYGVDNAHIASSGLYTISYWETGVGSRYTKNPNHPLASTISWTGESVKIIPGTNAQEIAFQAFLNGQLDGVGIPTAHLDDYAENPRVLRSPAGTIFSLNINMCGDVATQQQFFPGSQYVPEPILGNKDFRLALYFSLDRNRLKEYDPKTSPSSMKIGGSYFIDPELGVSYRDSPQGQSVGEDLSQETNGYDFDLALALFKRAVATEIANGNYSAGTSDNYTEISLNILTFDASGGKAIADHWLDFAEHFFGLLVDDDNYVRLTFTRTDKATTPLYDQIRAGNYDLALSAISGNSLDAASFLDVFCSDNRSNFLLNYGYNSNIPEIEVKWTENGRDYWQLLSFDAIVEILNHKSYLADGILATEHNTIDQLVEVFLGSHDLVEVSRSEEDGEYIAPTLYDDHDDTTTDDWAGLLADDDYDSIHGLTLTTQDEDGKVNQWLFIITETFGIYSVLNGYPQQIAYGFSDSDALANALSQEGLVAVDEIALSQTDVDDLVSWFELDTYSDVYIDYHLHAVNTTVGAYLVAILESNDGYFVKVVVEALYRESVQTELDGFVQSVLSEYIASSVHDTVNANTDALVTATPYLANYYNVNSYADAVTAFSAGYTDWFRLYYFQATSPDYNFAPGDYYIRAFTIAGFILFGEWL